MTQEKSTVAVQWPQGRPGPAEFLERFYADWGIEKESLTYLVQGKIILQEKERVMSEIVRIPNFPYNERKPALFELEKQFLRNNDYYV